jgi:predicted cobalt transporter CbtA
MPTLGSLLKAAVIAGVLAGAIVAGFHALLIEPLIERAIALEEPHGHSEAPQEPVVDRPTQRWGLLLGFVLYGAVWGLVLGLLASLARRWQPTAGSLIRYGIGLAALLGWSVALFPFLKYPANPPGVGEAETIGYRQALYVGFMALSALGTALAVGLFSLLRRRPRAGARSRWLAPMALYVVYAALLYALFPPNPDPMAMPAELVWTFRLVSFAGLAVFWLLLGGAFGWFARDTTAVTARR